MILKRSICILLVVMMLLSGGCSAPFPFSAPTASTMEAPTFSQDDEDSIEEEYTPEPSFEPGVWHVSEESFGVHGYGAMNYEKYLTETEQNNPALDMQPNPQSIKAASKVRLNIAEWTYFFDTSKPVPNIDGLDEFPVCRKNSEGKVENLEITGFKMAASPKYLFVYRNESSGDFTNWDTIRVSPDGKEKILCAGSIDLYIPTQGNYMYFYGGDWDLYRTDFAFETVEGMTVDIPDRAAIEKAIDYANGVRKVIFYDYQIRNGWLSFCLNAYNLERGDYFGHYRMKLSGGKAVKTDKGKLFFYEPYTE